MPRAANAFSMIGMATNSVVPGCNRGFDQRQALRRDLLADRLDGRFERGHLDLAGAHLAEVVLRVVALHVDDDAIGERQAVGVEGRRQRLLLDHAAADHRVDLGILRLHRRLAAVQQRDLPVAARARPLAADHELARLPGLLVDRVGDDRRHDGADEADAHHDHDLFAFGARRLGEPFEARHLGRVLVAVGKGELLSCGTDGNLGHRSFS